MKSTNREVPDLGPQLGQIVRNLNILTAEMQKKGVQVNRPNIAALREAALPLHREYIGKSFTRQQYDLAAGH